MKKVYKILGCIITFTLITFVVNAQVIDSMIDTRDDQVYQIVNIGDQWWMAENLNYKTKSGSWCYGDSISYCEIYGRLYSWGTAKRVCPWGWHLPSYKEWQTLIDFVKHGNIAVLLLMEKGTTHWSYPNSGTNEFGFSVLPGGYYGGDGNFEEMGHNAVFWTSSSANASKIWYRRSLKNRKSVMVAVFRNKNLVPFGYSRKAGGNSIRCIRNRIFYWN